MANTVAGDVSGMAPEPAAGENVSARQLLQRTHDAVRRVNSAIAKPSADRRHRFNMPEIISSAALAPTDAEYMSDEDTVAVYRPAQGRRPACWAIGTVERMIEPSTKGGRSNENVVHQLSVNNGDGRVLCHLFEPPLSSQPAKVSGERAFRSSLTPASGGWVEFSCQDVIAIVTMKYNKQHQVYVLDTEDEKGMNDWWQREVLSRSAQAASQTAQGAVQPSRRPQGVGPLTRAAKQMQKAARRRQRARP